MTRVNVSTLGCLWRVGVVCCLTVAVLDLEGRDSVGADLYLCHDASGSRLFTDTPTEFEHCQRVESDLEGSPGQSPQLESRTRSMLVPPADVAEEAEVPEEISEEASASAEVPGGGEASAATAEQMGEVTVEVQRVGHLLIVATKLNGSRQARLILDTGASHTILSSEVSQDLGLIGDPRSAIVTLKTAGGPVQAEIVRISSIRVADAEVRNSLAAVYDMPDAPPGIDGLLGLTFLSQFEVTLDSARGRLKLRHRSQ